jgi:hypothetical protein
VLIVLSALAAAPVVEAAPAPRPTRAAQAAARAVSRHGLMRRTDLGAAWTETAAAPRRAPSLPCGVAGVRTSQAVLAGSASVTWSDAAGTLFASGTSYGFAGAAAARQSWPRLGSASRDRCLKQQLEQGSGHGVVLKATGVRPLPAPRLTIAGRPVSISRYEVSGTATGAGQDVAVYLDVIVLRQGAWIAEDELSSAATAPPASLQARAARLQARRAGA